MNLEQDVKRTIETKGSFNMLVVQGGGLWGCGVARYLALYEKLLQDQYGKTVSNAYDMFAGTSTGSIIATGLAGGMTAEYIDLKYSSLGAKIFKDKTPFWTLTPKYKNTQLLAQLKKLFGKLEWAKIKPLLVTLTDTASYMSNKRVANYATSIDIGNMPVWKACACSCSAPTFFNSIDDRYVDGGMWANDPTMAVLSDLKGHNLDWSKINVHVLSTSGISIWKKPMTKKMNLLSLVKRIVDSLMSNSETSIERYAEADAGELGFNLRNDAPYLASGDNYEMDDVEHINDIRKIWGDYYKDEESELIKFTKELNL